MVGNGAVHALHIKTEAMLCLQTILHLLYILFFGREDVDDVVFAVETVGTDVGGKCGLQQRFEMLNVLRLVILVENALEICETTIGKSFFCHIRFDAGSEEMLVFIEEFLPELQAPCLFFLRCDKLVAGGVVLYSLLVGKFLQSSLQGEAFVECSVQSGVGRQGIDFLDSVFLFHHFGEIFHVCLLFRSHIIYACHIGVKLRLQTEISEDDGQNEHNGNEDRFLFERDVAPLVKECMLCLSCCLRKMGKIDEHEYDGADEQERTEQSQVS